MQHAHFEASINTWSKYLVCIRCRHSHILHGFSDFRVNKSWFTKMLCVSMPLFVSSCTNRSVSYNDKNSAMHTQIKVVWSCKQKIVIVYKTKIYSKQLQPVRPLFLKNQVSPHPQTTPLTALDLEMINAQFKFEVVP